MNDRERVVWDADLNKQTVVIWL